MRSDGVKLQQATSINVDGALEWEAGSVGVNQGTISVGAAGKFDISAAGAFWGGGQFVVSNAGAVTLDASGTAAIAGDYLTSGQTTLKQGILSITGKAQQTAGVFELQGRTTVQTPTLEIQGGLLNGDGTVDGNLKNGTAAGGQGGAVVMPGFVTSNTPIGGVGGGPASISFTPGTINVTGDYTQFGNGALTIYVDAGGTPGKLVVAGAANLAGILSVTVDTNYKPPAGTEVTFLTYASRQGDFGSKTLTSSVWQNPGPRRTYWQLMPPAGDRYYLRAFYEQGSGPPGGGGGS